MGGLVRCDGCGSILWNVLGIGGPDSACPTCGEPLKPERRRPGRKFGRTGAERRDLSSPPTGVAPPARPLSHT
jgi:hypothetical protein